MFYQVDHQQINNRLAEMRKEGEHMRLVKSLRKDKAAPRFNLFSLLRSRLQPARSEAQFDPRRTAQVKRQTAG
jgi:hypothetical protein